MKFIINQEVFSDILQQHLPVLPARTTIPILNSLKWDLDGRKLRMHSTDLEISLITEVEVDSEDGGAVAVPAKKLSEIVRELSGEPVTVEIDEKFRIKLYSLAGVYQIAGSNPEDFPVVPDEGMKEKMVISGEKYKRLVNQTAFAVSHDDMRPTLCGIFLQASSDDIRTVATDGHRLSKFVDSSFKGGEEIFDVIVPLKALQLATKTIADEDEIKISATGKYIMVEYQGNCLYSRLIEGKYPLYENVIPKNNQNILVANVETFTSALRRVSIFSNFLTKQVKLTISKNRVVISAEDVETGGEAEEGIDVDYQGEEMPIGFNAKYVIDALNYIDSDEVKILLGTSDSASIFEPIEQRENESFFVLLMPVRLP